MVPDCSAAEPASARPIRIARVFWWEIRSHARPSERDTSAQTITCRSETGSCCGHFAVTRSSQALRRRKSLGCVPNELLGAIRQEFKNQRERRCPNR